MEILIYSAVGLFLMTLIGLLLFLSRSLGYYEKKDEDYEQELSVQEKRKDITSRPASEPDDILKRMRTDSQDK